MKKTQKDKFYVAPQGEFIELQAEQCLASSGEPGGNLDGLDSNDLWDEFIS